MTGNLSFISMKTKFSFILDSNMIISSSNSTQDTNETRKFVKPSALPASTTFTLGVVGNVIAIIVLIRTSKRHKWNVFNRLVATLVVNDLFGILTTSPVPFVVYANNFKWVGGQPVCDYVSFMLIRSGLSTVLLAGVMAIDRYLAVLHPFRYNVAARNTIVNFVIIGIWLFSVFVGLLPIFGLGENVKHFPGTWCFFNFFGKRIVDHIFSYLYCFLGLGTICMIGFLNICVIRGLVAGKGSNSLRGNVAKRKARVESDIYITVFLVVMFLVFAVCWAPFLIRIVINQSHLFPRDIKVHVDLLTLRLATLNQILDPWVYNLLRPEVLSRMVRFWRKQKRGTAIKPSSHGKEVTTVQDTTETQFNR